MALIAAFLFSGLFGKVLFKVPDSQQALICLVALLGAVVTLNYLLSFRGALSVPWP